MRDAFDVLYREGEKGSAKLLSIGPHGLIKASGSAVQHIAQHWLKHFPAKAA